MTKIARLVYNNTCIDMVEESKFDCDGSNMIMKSYFFKSHLIHLLI